MLCLEIACLSVCLIKFWWGTSTLLAECVYVVGGILHYKYNVYMLLVGYCNIDEFFAQIFEVYYVVGKMCLHYWWGTAL